jgi:purine-binding chemotaxis protein CheW
MNASPREPAVSGWLLFRLDHSRFALPLASVERLVRAAEVTPLPLAPPAVLGAVDVAGRILPVFDLRSRFGFAPRDIDPTQQFIIARARGRTVVLLIDVALGLADASEIRSALPAPGPGVRHVGGVFSLPDGLAVIHDLESLLNDDEESQVDAALREAQSSRAR